MDELRVRARDAYERARLLGALPWALWPIVLAALALFAGTAAPPLAVVIGAAVAVAVVAARFTGRETGRAVLSALAFGSAAFALAWFAVVIACVEGCPVEGEAPRACALSGVAIGAIVGALLRPQGSIPTLLVPVIAGACGALGCAYAGIAAVIGLMAGMAIATAPWIVWRTLRRA